MKDFDGIKMHGAAIKKMGEDIVLLYTVCTSKFWC